TTATFDRGGNRLSRGVPLAPAFDETYTYDALGQLDSFRRGPVAAPATTQQWQFDALGNWNTFTTDATVQPRTHNAQNELTQVGTQKLSYSATGNLTADAQGRSLAFDAWNRLVSVRDSAGRIVARYEYDGLNRRVVEQVGPVAATAPIRDIYYSAQWQVLEERLRTTSGDIGRTAEARYVWSPVYVDALVMRDRDADGLAATGTGGLEERLYAIQDANWNTTAVVAAAGVRGVLGGAVIARFVYTPYGESQALTASWAPAKPAAVAAISWQHLFQGLEFTEITGLAYVRNRDYSASLGRFIERDPIGFKAGDNNWYRFVGNRPTTSTDPLGLIILCVGVGISGGYYGAGSGSLSICCDHTGVCCFVACVGLGGGFGLGGGIEGSLGNGTLTPGWSGRVNGQLDVGYGSLCGTLGWGSFSVGGGVGLGGSVTVTLEACYTFGCFVVGGGGGGVPPPNPTQNCNNAFEQAIRQCPGYGQERPPFDPNYEPCLRRHYSDFLKCRAAAGSPLP
ncbi:MAG: RHS repeat-associated core domain-containing protein, partial [Planctomycetes bacterium]|nr:RHS repeat-associated core domain-containing protein [Planctomycetota bacterium]